METKNLELDRLNRLEAASISQRSAITDECLFIRSALLGGLADEKISYLDHLSPYGVQLKDVGRIHSPFLKDILKIGYTQYQYALTLFLYTPEKYYHDAATMMKMPDIWEQMTSEQKANIAMFDILTSTDESRAELISALGLFVSGKLEWDEQHRAIFIDKENSGKKGFSIGGYIDRNNYSTVTKLCLQMVDIDESDIPEEAPKFKTEKDRLFYEKFQKKKKKFKQTKKADPNFELPNMISLLCTFHPSLNYSNIFELTVGQIRDTFSQLLRAKQLNIAEMNYSVWGGKYDPSKWIERIDKENETIGG